MSIPLPPLPSIREWPHSHEELRARDLEVARLVLEAAAQRVALHVWHSQECENAINGIRALEFQHAE